MGRENSFLDCSFSGVKLVPLLLLIYCSLVICLIIFMTHVPVMEAINGMSDLHRNVSITNGGQLGTCDENYPSLS